MRERERERQRALAQKEYDALLLMELNDGMNLVLFDSWICKCPMSVPRLWWSFFHSHWTNAQVFAHYMICEPCSKTRDGLSDSLEQMEESKHTHKPNECYNQSEIKHL